MAEFYIEKTAKDTGEHIVHSSICSALPDLESMKYLGAFSNPNAPVNKAKNWFPKISVCPTCVTA